MNAQDILKHLENDYTKPVRDPLWKHIYLTPALEKAIITPPFARLGRLRQLGLAVQVYPGATHTRANHSLGVFHLAKRIIQTILRSRDYPGHLSLEGVKAFLCAALFHDLGHFPYAHVLEDGLPVKHHETLTGQYILDSELTPLLKNEVGTEPALAAAIVDHHLDVKGRMDEVRFFRRLLSGVLDPDKMDYLNRDAYFCGIPYGVQDTDFIISQIIPHKDYGIGLAPKGIISVEHLLFSKYLMYKSVYWHKGVRSPSGIIKKALYLGITQNQIDPTTLYGLDDVGFASTLAAIDFPPFQQILQAEVPGSFVTLHEEAYDENSLFAYKFQDTKSRLELEDEIRLAIMKQTGETLAPEEITIDIPHSVSFEVDLPIIKDGRLTPFTDSGTVFDKNVVRGFTSTLKRMRLIGPARLKGRVKQPEVLMQ